MDSHLQTIVIGLPGSGKSTMIRGLLAEHASVGHFGVRLYFKREVAAGTEIGRRAEHYVRNGLWIPDDLLMDAVRAEFELGLFTTGFVIEGIPATAAQARLLDELLTGQGLREPMLIYIEAPDDVCLARATRRSVCETCDGGVEPAHPNQADPRRCAHCDSWLSRRWDDDEEPFRRRLALHRSVVAEILPYYDPQRTLVVDGRLPREELLMSVLDRLSANGHFS